VESGSSLATVSSDIKKCARGSSSKIQAVCDKAKIKFVFLLPQKPRKIREFYLCRLSVRLNFYDFTDEEVVFEERRKRLKGKGA